MDFYSQAGTMALGTRLRRLGETLKDSAAQINRLYRVPLDPKWFPVYYVLSKHDGLSVTDIARHIGHTHPSVSQIVKEMAAEGLVSQVKSQADGRVNVIRLSEKGRELVPVTEREYADVGAVVEELLADTRHDLWKALEEVEYQLRTKDLLSRVKEKYQEREAARVQIVDYSAADRENFKRLNLKWIEKYFVVEEQDLVALDDPEGEVLEPGGHIFMARYDGCTVGTCALLNAGDGSYELAKMAVGEEAQGKGIGYLLGAAILEKAGELGAARVFLESNTSLEPAINLYRKLGFERYVGGASPYERSNIQMQIFLD